MTVILYNAFYIVNTFLTCNNHIPLFVRLRYLPLIISAIIIYCRAQLGCGTLKKHDQPDTLFENLKVGEIEVFLIGNKEKLLQDQEFERKII